MNIFRFLKKKEERTPEQLYYDGKVNAQLCEYELALDYYSKAANMGLKEAQYDLAVLYYYGKGTAINKKKAAELLKPLAETRMPEAEELLAVMYFLGEGVNRDYDMAFKYFQKGIVMQNEEALLYGGLCLVNKGNLDHEKIGKVIKYWSKAAELGSSVAAVNLGLMYREGNLVAKDDHEAFKWFLMAAEKDHHDGIFYVGLSYAEGRGVEKNIEKSKFFYEKGFALGDVNCAHNLGTIYLDNQDFKNAYVCYKFAADNGSLPSKKMVQDILQYVNALEMNHWNGYAGSLILDNH